MKHLVATTAILAALSVPASATVVIDNSLSGTGDNVTFQSFGGNLATGTFNGQHTGIVDFTDLSNNPLFTGSANGNDIKIQNTNDLDIQVFSGIGGTLLGTTTQVFSLKGTGDVIASMFAVDMFGNIEGVQSFDLGQIDPHAQSGFTFSTIDGEVMYRMVLFDLSGSISDYEHYRIDVAALPQVAATPLPASAFLLAMPLVGLVSLARRKRTNRLA